uniref:Uncharacterized protein n=1 Tax=Mycena chlorophos TaxID=658473 RepID=A0ABQ0LG51_MYCCL|nr:predicted protein [Mycena chlorophos]
MQTPISFLLELRRDSGRGTTATYMEIPSHNNREVDVECMHVLRNDLGRRRHNARSQKLYLHEVPWVILHREWTLACGSAYSAEGPVSRLVILVRSEVALVRATLGDRDWDALNRCRRFLIALPTFLYVVCEIGTAVNEFAPEDYFSCMLWVLETTVELVGYDGAIGNECDVEVLPAVSGASTELPVCGNGVRKRSSRLDDKAPAICSCERLLLSSCASLRSPNATGFPSSETAKGFGSGSDMSPMRVFSETVPVLCRFCGGSMVAGGGAGSSSRRYAATVKDALKDGAGPDGVQVGDDDGDGSIGGDIIRDIEEWSKLGHYGYYGGAAPALVVVEIKP